MNHIDLIKSWEGLRLEAYLPTPNDVWTIGYGHTKGVMKGDVITEDQAEILLERDVAWAVEAVDALVVVPLTTNQRSALISFVYNIGRTQFATSTLLKKLNVGDYEGAAHEFPRWNKQAGKVLNGLVNRRAQEMAIFLKAEDSSQNVSVDPIEPLKPLTLSKEITTGVAAILTAAGTFLSHLNDQAQTITVSVAAGGLVVFGIIIIGNRLWARRKGER